MLLSIDPKGESSNTLGMARGTSEVAADPTTADPLGDGADTHGKLDPEHRLKEAVSIMGDGLAVYGPDGCLEFCNDSFRRIHGYSEQDTRIGAATYDTLGRLDVARGIIDYTPLSFEHRREQLRRDGANTAIQHYGARVYERRQSVTPSGGMINLITDITDRHQLELAQQGRNHVLELLATGHPLEEILHVLTKNCEAMFPDMLASVLLLDHNGRHLLLGAAPSLPKAYNEATHGLEIGPKVGSCGTAAFTGRTVIVSDIATDPHWEGISHVALEAGLKACWSHPIYSSTAKVLGTFAVYYRDVRAPVDEELAFIRETAQLAGIAIEAFRGERSRRAALERAEHANKAKSEFLATMSHEFRTPLNAILGFSDMLGQVDAGVLPPEKFKEYAADIHASGRHLLGLIDDVLDISEIEAGRRHVDKSPIDVKSTLESCLHNVTPQAKEAGIDLVCEIADDLPTLHADKRSVVQIVLNLLSNAIKFTGAGGRVILTVEADDKNVRFTVRDTGIGIPEDALPTITEPFSKGHTNPLVAETGTGLGLSIVQSLVDAHDGALDIASTVRQGTTVTVALPLGRAAD